MAELLLGVNIDHIATLRTRAVPLIRSGTGGFYC